MSWRRRSYDAVPALSLRGPHLRDALRFVTAAWMFGVVWLSAVSGGHFKLFAETLGCGAFAFGVLASMPFVATFGQLIAALLIEQTGLVKYQFIHFAAAHRLLWLVVAAIPIVLPIPSSAAVAALVGVLTLSWFLGALATPAWLTWMGMLVPRRIRGRYFASRERRAVIVQVFVVMALGLVMDLAHRPAGPVAQPSTMWLISGILALAAVFGTVDILLFRKVPEVLLPAEQDVSGPPRTPLRKLLVEPLKDGAFRSYVLYGATMTFSMTVVGWFYWLQAIDVVGFSNLAANVLFLAVAPLASIWGLRRWGRAIDRWGRRPVLIVCTAGASLSLAMWFVISPELRGPAVVVDALAWLAATVGGWFGRPGWTPVGPSTPVGAYLLAAVAAVLGGVNWAGIGLAQTGIVLGFAGGSGRSRYVAASSVLISAGGVLGGLTGGLIAHALGCLRADPIRLGPLLWNNYHATFLAALLARGATIYWLMRMPDPGAAKVRALARYMGTNVYHGLVTRLFYSLRVFGWQQPRNSARPAAAADEESRRR